MVAKVEIARDRSLSAALRLNNADFVDNDYGATVDYSVVSLWSLLTTAL